MGQCMTVSKELVLQARESIGEAAEDVKAYVDSYNARRYRHVNTDVTDEQDTNIIAYDEPENIDNPDLAPSLIQGEREIEKIFEDKIDEHI